ADLKDSDVSSPYEENDMDLHIGSGVDSNGDVIRQSKSRLDDVRTYNRALSASEIKNLYNNSGQVVRNANRNDRYTNGLFGHWTFDASTVSGTDVEDVSGNDNDGTLHAPSLVGAGLLGQGLRTDTEVYPPFSHPLLTDDEWTASVWVNPATNEQDSGFRTVFGADSTAGVGSDRLFFDTGNQFRIRLNGTNTVFSPQAYFSGINKWNYVTLTKEFDGGSTYTYNIYINGEFKGTIDSSVGIFLDRFGASKSETGHRYVGKADDYRVYDRALSAEEVKGLYNATKPSTENANRNDLLTNGLVGHWSFDGPDVSASTADDVSGNGNDGTLNGDVSPAAGVIGQGFSFDGSGDYILVSPMDGLTNLTVSGWIYRENNSTWHALSSRQTGSNSTRNWWLGGESGQNKAFFSMYSSGGAANSHSSNGDLPQEEWTHITGTYNGSAMKIYINGALDKTIETSFTPVTSSADMAIGARGDGGTHYLDGLVDDVRIYNRALSADEVKRLYHMGR
ncbi:MAG: LamG domain-containing protein, partial [Candidatus Paceibacterota bacterium]